MINSGIPKKLHSSGDKHMHFDVNTYHLPFIHNVVLFYKYPLQLEQERPLMQSIKGRRLIVYACVICWTTRNNQGQSPLSL